MSATCDSWPGSKDFARNRQSSLGSNHSVYQGDAICWAIASTLYQKWYFSDTCWLTFVEAVCYVGKQVEE